MLQISPIACMLALCLAEFANSQQFSPLIAYDKVVESPINPNITISYREPKPGTCVTDIPGQKQYSGYVNLPPFALAPYQQDYPVKTFFWFFESRNNSDSAPLTIWLNSGPGSSSMIGLFREPGPCEVVQLPDSSYDTKVNPWGWDRSSNLLFIDQPTRVEFSSDQAMNVSRDIRTNKVIQPPSEGELPLWAQNNSNLVSGGPDHMQNSTFIAARAVWHLLQGFLSTFPQYNPGHLLERAFIQPTSINLFTKNYGGIYGPIFANFFEDQNERRRIGEIPSDSTLEISISSLGIVNGLVDEIIQTSALASFAYNNTYGIESISHTQSINFLSDFRKPGGCKELANQCNIHATAESPDGKNLDQDTADVCERASDVCWRLTNAIIQRSGRSPYDIRATSPHSFSSLTYLEYLNYSDGQRFVGTKANYTGSNYVVHEAFRRPDDTVRGTEIQKLAELLDRGIKVAFIYGDADMICNWVGGELVSLAVAQNAPSHAMFPIAGYADIISNSSYVGGHVRQYGNLSFSRIFDAGHTVPSYQAETAFVVFSRIIQDNDISMGRKVDLTTFGTNGPARSLRQNNVPLQPKNIRWVQATQDNPDRDQVGAIGLSSGVVIDGHAADYIPPLGPNGFIGKPGSSIAGIATNWAHKAAHTSISSLPLTNVFITAATPTSTGSRVRPISDNDYDRARKILCKKGRKRVLAASVPLGGMLLLCLTGYLITWRHHRKRRHGRKFFGGPASPSTLVFSKDVATNDQTVPTIIHESAPLTPPDTIVEKPPLLDHRPARHSSGQLEPIPEVHSPHPSIDKNQHSPLPERIENLVEAIEEHPKYPAQPVEERHEPAVEGQDDERNANLSDPLLLVRRITLPDSTPEQREVVLTPQEFAELDRPVSPKSRSISLNAFPASSGTQSVVEYDPPRSASLPVAAQPSTPLPTEPEESQSRKQSIFKRIRESLTHGPREDEAV